MLNKGLNTLVILNLIQDLKIADQVRNDKNTLKPKESIQ
jgi:hypothetical protein